MDQFARTALLYGRENVEKLKNRHVAIFGLGGVGGHCAEALCRSGVGALDLFDGDVVDITNINRQIIATHKTVGRDKVAVMQERLLEINPNAMIAANKIFYLPDTADCVDLSIYDYIVDAVDTIAAKLEIVCRAAALGIPVISSMGAANKFDPTRFEVADIYDTSVCPMARIMRSELRKRGITSLKVVYSKEPPGTPYLDDKYLFMSGEEDVYFASDSGARMRSGAQLRQDVSPEREGSKKTSFERKDLNKNNNNGKPDYAKTVSADKTANGNRYRRQIPASNACVPPVAGLIIASEVVNALCDRYS